VNGLADQVTLAAEGNVSIRQSGQSVIISAPRPAGTLSGYEVRSSLLRVTYLSEGTAEVDCVDGKQAIGGGSRASPPLEVIREGPQYSYVTLFNDTLEGLRVFGWRAVARNHDLINSHTLTVFVVCASVSP
jgi:hypothetical protein